MIARYAYEPFGSLTTTSGLVEGELHRFTGKPSDLETDLSYFNARYYDSALGRFTSSDPAKDGLNWYQYCNGNPMAFVDNNGMWTVAVGINFSLNYLFRVSGSLSFVFDGCGGMGILFSPAIGAGLPAITVGSQLGITNAHSIELLSDYGFEAGGSLGKVKTPINGLEYSIGDFLDDNIPWTGVNTAINDPILSGIFSWLLKAMEPFYMEMHGELSNSFLFSVPSWLRKWAVSILRSYSLTTIDQLTLEQRLYIENTLGVDIDDVTRAVNDL